MGRIAASLVIAALLGLCACSNSYTRHADQYRGDPHCAVHCGIQNVFG